MMKISYTRRDSVVIDILLENEHICCGEHVDTQYYLRKGLRRTNECIMQGNIGTDVVFDVCYDQVNEANNVPNAEVVNKMNTGGKQFLPIRRGCF